jgi:hypothetical protein
MISIAYLYTVHNYTYTVDTLLGKPPKTGTNNYRTEKINYRTEKINYRTKMGNVGKWGKTQV